AALSAPIATGEGAASAALADALILVEASSADAARRAAQQLATLADVEPSQVRGFDLLWRLAA
ncbi:hypothetical protein G3N92_31720, partial [Burkholderia sp. Ac-20379]|nr:hypothetical protein [Burkholderia sp. Ac-20379]